MSTKYYQMADWVRLNDIQTENNLSNRQLLQHLLEQAIKVFWKIPKEMEVLLTSRANIMIATMRDEWGDNGAIINRPFYSSGIELGDFIVGREPVEFVCLTKNNFTFSLPYVELQPATTYLPRLTVQKILSENTKVTAQTIHDAYENQRLEMREITNWTYDHLQEVFENDAIRYPIFDSVYSQTKNGLVEEHYDEQDDCSLFTQNIFIVREKSDQGWRLISILNELKVAKSDLYLLESEVTQFQSSLPKLSVAQPVEIHQHHIQNNIQINQYQQTDVHVQINVAQYEHKEEIIEVHMDAPVETKSSTESNTFDKKSLLAILTDDESTKDAKNTNLLTYLSEKPHFSDRLKKLLELVSKGDQPVKEYKKSNTSEKLLRANILDYLEQKLGFSPTLAKGIVSLLKYPKKTKPGEEKPWIGINDSSRLLIVCEVAEELWKKPFEIILQDWEKQTEEEKKAGKKVIRPVDFSRYYWKKYPNGIPSVELPSVDLVESALVAKDKSIKPSTTKHIANLIRMVQDKNMLQKNK